MLRKLLKHEFRATGRIMLPLYLVLLATAVGANVSGQIASVIAGGLILNFFG